MKYLKRSNVYLIIWYLLIAIVSLKSQGGRTPIIPHFDKIAHFSVYALLSVFWFATLKQKLTYFKSMLYTFLLSVLTGILFEFLQLLFTSNRQAEVLDAVANTFGVIIGLCFYHLFINNRKLEICFFKTE